MVTYLSFVKVSLVPSNSGASELTVTYLSFVKVSLTRLTQVLRTVKSGPVSFPTIACQEAEISARSTPPAAPMYEDSDNLSYDSTEAELDELLTPELLEFRLNGDVSKRGWLHFMNLDSRAWERRFCVSVFTVFFSHHRLLFSNNWHIWWNTEQHAVNESFCLFSLLTQIIYKMLLNW